jgi:predicted AAA+ superfamily ATPase
MSTKPHNYIKRSLEKVALKAASEFPAVVLTGPRQQGKTTLLQHLFAEDHRYVSLELPDVRAAAAEDPRGFLDAYPPPAIFDEVQYCTGYPALCQGAHRLESGPRWAVPAHWLAEPAARREGH